MKIQVSWAAFIAFLAIAAVGVCIAFFVPSLVIWSLNTLFALAIPYNFQTWLAMVIILIVMHETVSIWKK